MKYLHKDGKDRPIGNRKRRADPNIQPDPNDPNFIARHAKKSIQLSQITDATFAKYIQI